jgi:putative endonuclease
MNSKDTTQQARQTLKGHAEASGTAGRLAEDLAARFLEKRGLRVLRRNYRCRGGEIDLIARDGKTLVFVEVRLRRNTNYGGAGASITPAKQRRIILAARHYLAEHDASDVDCRFDCILLSATSEHQIDWLRDAFSAD